MLKRYVCILVFLAQLSIGSCRTKPRLTQHDAGLAVQVNSSAAPTPGAYEPDVPVPDFLSQIPFRSKAEMAGMIAAWKKIPNHTRFRAVRNGYSQQAVHDYGEIAGAYGLALFVVDITKTELDRFGLIIMLQRPRDRYDVYWIFRDTDFSNLTLSRSSGSLFVRRSGANKEETVCRIEWVRAKGKWTCE